MSIKIFCDGANVAAMLEMSPSVSGFTTNPTLMKKEGIKDYFAFAQDALKTIQDKPISFEVFADDRKEMKEQALKLAALGDNVYVKVPVCDTAGTKNSRLIKELSQKHKVKLNITAVFTLDQVKSIRKVIDKDVPCVVSIFAGRIADTGVDPIPVMKKAKMLLKKFPLCELLWASPREVLNIYQAEECETDIITATPEILKKYELMKAKNLDELCVETVQMFYSDGKSCGFTV